MFHFLVAVAARGPCMHGESPMTRASDHAIRPGTLSAIIEAAIGMLNVDPGATMSDIARAAGVGRTTLHRHFDGKADLLSTIEAQCIEETNAAVRATDVADGAAVERLRNMLRSVIPLGDRYAFLLSESLRDEGLRGAHEAQIDWIRTLMEQLKAERAIAGEVPTAWAVALVDQVIFTAWTVVSTGELSTDEAAALALRSLLKGLG